jgi:hypothetical protein
MQESEARTKWCPFARVNPMIDERTAVNRPQSEAPPSAIGDMQARTRCYGSGCMAWRWHGMGAETLSGFCGLAGAEGAR